MRVSVGALALLVGAWAGGAQAQSPDIGAVMDASFAPWRSITSPGCAVSLKQGDQPAVERAYGSADLEHDVPITPGTVFEAGSVAKQFTAAALLTLVQDGRVRLADDVRRHLPELPAYGAPVTLEMLLNHTSGLRDWGDVMAAAGWPRTSRAYAPADVLEIARRQRSLNYPPGQEYSYTNTGYNLAAEVVARVTGQTLAQFTKARLFDPLGMGETQWRDDFRRVVRGRAIAYDKDARGGWRQVMPFEDTYGHGALLTTVADLQRWNTALDAGSLGPVVTAELQRRSRLSDGREIPYARGVVVQTHRGVREVSHGGATAAYRAWLGRYPDQRLSIAILCNAADVRTEPLGRAIAEPLLPSAPPSEAAPTAALADLAAKAGLYVESRNGQTLELVADGAGLKLASGAALPAVAPDRLRYGASEIVFDGPDRLTVRWSDKPPVVYARSRRAQPTAAQLAAIAGVYSSEEARAGWRVSVESGRLVARPLDRASEAVTLTPLYPDAFTGSGLLVRVRRDKAGKVEALSFGTPRIWDLRFRRTG